MTFAVGRRWWICAVGLTQALGWLVFARDNKPHGFSASGAVLLVVLTLPILVLGVAAASSDWPIWAIVAIAIIGLSGLVSAFAELYWNAGSSTNWTVRLSHLDAIYVALGALTTAGAAGLAPKTEAARALVTGQLGIEVVIVPLLLGLVTAAFNRDRR